MLDGPRRLENLKSTGPRGPWRFESLAGAPTVRSHRQVSHQAVREHPSLSWSRRHFGHLTDAFVGAFLERQGLDRQHAGQVKNLAESVMGKLRTPVIFRKPAGRGQKEMILRASLVWRR